MFHSFLFAVKLSMGLLIILRIKTTNKPTLKMVLIVTILIIRYNIVTILLEKGGIVFMRLTTVQANELSFLYAYKELKKLDEKREAGYEVSDLEKKTALESCLPPYQEMITGTYSKEEILDIVSEWKSFFSSFYPVVYEKKIAIIEQINCTLQEV